MRVAPAGGDYTHKMKHWTLYGIYIQNGDEIKLAIDYVLHTAFKISSVLDSFIASVEFCKRACIIKGVKRESWI